MYYVILKDNGTPTTLMEINGGYDEALKVAEDSGQEWEIVKTAHPENRWGAPLAYPWPIDQYEESE